VPALARAPPAKTLQLSSRAKTPLPPLPQTHAGRAPAFPRAPEAALPAPAAMSDDAPAAASGLVVRAPGADAAAAVAAAPTTHHIATAHVHHHTIHSAVDKKTDAEAEAANSLADYIKSIVFGGLDGIVTTFAIVASVVGADFPIEIVILTGFAKLLGDGACGGSTRVCSTYARARGPP
jgi:hypothetical protein